MLAREVGEAAREAGREVTEWSAYTADRDMGCGASGWRRRPRSRTPAAAVGVARLRAGRPMFRAPRKSPRGIGRFVLVLPPADR